jgi:hypothetical protein
VNVGLRRRWRAVDWALKGVPLRVELGPRDLEADAATLARRLSVEGAPAGLVVYDADPRADLFTVDSPRRMVLRGAVVS